MPGLFSKLLSSSCGKKKKKKTFPLRKWPTHWPKLWQDPCPHLARHCGSQKKGESMVLWEKYGSMGVNSTFKPVLCFFFFFSPPWGSAWLLTCPSPGSVLRMPLFGKLKAEWLLVQSHMRTHDLIIFCLYIAALPGIHTGRVWEKDGSEHPKKMWWEPLNTTRFFLPCPTKIFTLTPSKKETFPFLSSFFEHFTLRRWPVKEKPCKPVSLSLFYRSQYQPWLNRSSLMSCKI